MSTKIKYILLVLLVMSLLTQCRNSEKKQASTSTEKQSLQEVSTPKNGKRENVDELLNGVDSSKREIKEVPKPEKKVPKDSQKEKPKKKKKKYSKIVFAEDVYDFGEIYEGDTVHIEFPFVNKGNAPLEIKSAKATCGCTQPNYPFIDIEKGEKASVKVRYISIGKEGDQTATITVKTNGLNSPSELLIKGKVLPKVKQKLPKKDSINISNDSLAINKK